MKQLSYTQILRELAPENLDGLPDFRVSVLRNISVEAIEPYLRYYSYVEGVNLSCQFGEYDNVYQEAVGGNDSLFDPDVRCIILMIKIDSLSVDLTRRFPCLSQEDIGEEQKRVCSYIDDVLAGIRRQTSAVILWSGFELPVYPSMGILDVQEGNTQSAVVGELNRYLRVRLNQMDAAYYLDTNMILARVGAGEFYDNRYWHIGKAPYSRNALQETAKEVTRYLRPLMGKSRKCLVLDCDNTLWGGIIGEDGLASIALGTTHPGSAYHEFQQEIVNYYHRGVLIALCSKNNPEDVWAVFDRHPDMVLRREHIATAQINWNDKVSNLKKIASDLNIGLDSLVFVDDSEFEIDLVRRTLAEVKTIHASKDKAVEFRTILSACGYFDVLSVSDEDRKRGEMYKADTARKESMSVSTDLEAYLESLQMVLEIGFATDFSIPRIAQLTQKTNQFNLTTRRYSESDVRLLVDDRQADVIQVSLRDRFGEMGIIGVCIVKYNGSVALVDSFMLSCRALGRGVEHAFLAQVVKRAGTRSVQTLAGEYIPTRKNVQVRTFFPDNGFGDAGRVDDVLRYEMLLDTYEGGQQLNFKEINCSFEDGTTSRT